MATERADARGPAAVLEVRDLVVAHGTRIAVDGIGFGVERGE